MKQEDKIIRIMDSIKPRPGHNVLHYAFSTLGPDLRRDEKTGQLHLRSDAGHYVPVRLDEVMQTTNRVRAAQGMQQIVVNPNWVVPTTANEVDE